MEILKIFLTAFIFGALLFLIAGAVVIWWISR